MFKNETHNHPTEIEPFGGAATCLGGAIRDPLSGRSYVYQAMRVTGAANPLVPVEDTISGKLPQRKITVGAANGYSSYGNQIGLATGHVSEIYHPGYVAKRLEIGAVVGAAPAEISDVKLLPREILSYSSAVKRDATAAEAPQAPQSRIRLNPLNTAAQRCRRAILRRKESCRGFLENRRLQE